MPIFKSAIFLAAAFLLTSCLPAGVRSDKKGRSPHRFKTEVMLSYTPVKNQGRSPLCWAYSMLATIETEHIMMGLSLIHI